MSVLFLAHLSPASAGAPQPMCLVPSVLDEMIRTIKQHDYYAHIEPRLMAEQPAPAANTVWCAASVSTLNYDTYRFNGMPLWRCEQYMFSVRAVPGGFVVRYLNKGPWLRARR
jgi:hypothetical protein